jgi:hypothetical protein
MFWLARTSAFSKCGSMAAWNAGFTTGIQFTAVVRQTWKRAVCGISIADCRAANVAYEAMASASYLKRE